MFPMSGRQLAGTLVAATLVSMAWPVRGADETIPTAELDPHYRGPKGTHAYTRAMMELAMRMGAATTAALRNNNPERAREALKSFREQQAKVAAMVPSWRGLFPAAPIEELANAVSAKASVEARREIVTRIEKSCTACHARYMFPVQAHYRWGNFSAATAQTENGELTFHQLMLDLASGLGAVRGDVAAGQVKEALAAFTTLRERFVTMELLCANCHEQPRQYFVDINVKQRLLKMGGLLRKGEKRPTEYAPLFNDINEMSCLPCHQVHMPAAFLQMAHKGKH